MIKFRNSHIKLIADNQELFNKLRTKEFTIQTTYKLSLIFHEIETLSQSLEDARLNLVNRYAVKDENGEAIRENDQIKISNMQEFINKLNQLFEVENTISHNKISFDPEQEPRLSINEMQLILPFIELKEGLPT